MRRRITKLLTCPGCGVIVATAVYQRWPGDLVLTSLEGHRLHPMGGALQVRIAEQEAVEASSSTDREQARARLDFLERHLGELIYDLRCRNGHRIVRTMPQIVDAMRRTAGDWVSLQ